MVRQIEFLIPILLISRRRKLPLYMNDNYTHHKSWQFFLVEKLNASNLQYIWFFSRLVCSFEKPKETRSGFHVLANEKSWSNAVSKEVNR